MQRTNKFRRVATRSTNGTLAVLGFHKIGKAPDGWDTWFYIPETTFSEHLRFLRDGGWKVIDAATFLRGLDAPESLPKRSALLTFDDGCRQFLDVALPWLCRFKYSSVHFVPTGYIGKKNTFDRGVEPEEPIFTWTELRRLGRWGVSIGSHGVTHRPFSELNGKQIDQELLRSKATLERGLKKRVDLFAFPKGDEGANSRRVSRALRRIGYRAAFRYGGGPIRLPMCAPYRLTRLAVGPDTKLEFELIRNMGSQRETHGS